MKNLTPVPHAYEVVHEIKGRMRLRPFNASRSFSSSKDIALYLGPLAEHITITLSPKTSSILFTYTDENLRPLLRNHIGMCWQKPTQVAIYPSLPLRTQPKSTSNSQITQQQAPLIPRVYNPIPTKLLSFILPGLINTLIAFKRSIPFIFKGMAELAKGRLGLDVLDAAALGVCLFRRDFRTLASITFFFSLSEFLDHWTRKKSHANLAKSLALNITHVWVKQGDAEYETLLADVCVGDILVIRAGAVIPIDGTVTEGDALVNQASMTGEPLPVHRFAGSTVYAGSIVEEGELYIKATKISSETRINNILRYIEDSEKAKASIQSKYEHIADAIVPYNLALAGLVYLLTRSSIRAGAVLLVDYSCAIRLSTPLSILSAMQEAVENYALIKGGAFLENLAHANAVVLDKTGTLTKAEPKVTQVIAFTGYDEDTVLRLAACLEEHFPHPVGQAVVHAAKEKNLHHQEEHAKVEFVVAHGIASSLQNQRVLIGSAHFVLEDEKIPITQEQKKAAQAQAKRGHSILYLAIGNALAGIIAIEDSLREDIPQFIQALKNSGIERIVMLTGDGEETAKAVANKAGISEYACNLLPEQKVNAITSLQKEGYTVLMIGDGINDAPALSAADVGAALTSGADMAKEVADIILTQGNPAHILPARYLAQLTLKRIEGNFRKSVFWNSLFLAGALTGLLRPSISALLHNASTAVIAVQSMTPMLNTAPVTQQTPTPPVFSQQVAPYKKKTNGKKANLTKV